jgi:hypothetical protein
LKPGALSSYGSKLDSTCTAPHHGALVFWSLHSDASLASRSVAVQVAFEKANFETRISHFRLKGWVTRRFQAMGHNWIQLVQPHRTKRSAVLSSSCNPTPPANRVGTFHRVIICASKHQSATADTYGPVTAVWST